MIPKSCILAALLLSGGCGGGEVPVGPSSSARETGSAGGLRVSDYGRFSMSLSVRDIRVSRQFYQKLGFEILDDHEEEKWVIIRRGDTMIGLFQDMFERNILTFNPDDVRAVQRQLKENGLELSSEADEATTGPAFLTLEDPDGNPIVFDQLDPDYQPTSPE